MHWSKVVEWAGVLIGAVLMIGGGVGMWCCPSGLGRSLSEAFFIAGVLTIAVDPILKRRMLKEASKDIFHHLLGFGLPEAIRDRLRQIVNNTDLYRKDMTMTCSFSETGTGIRVDFETRYEVINPTPRTRPFRQYLAFEKAEHPELRSVALSGVSNYGKDAKFVPRGGEEFVLEYRGRGVKIKPESAGQRSRRRNLPTPIPVRSRSWRRWVDSNGPGDD